MKPAFLLSLCLWLSTAHAFEPERPADSSTIHDQLQQVLTDPAVREQSSPYDIRWRPTFKFPETKASLDPSWIQTLAHLSKLIGSLLGYLLWILLALAVCWVLYYYQRWWPYLRELMQPQTVNYIPEVWQQADEHSLEALPANIPQQAERLWQQGQQRAALSLLYRGALAYFSQQGIAVLATATEGENLALVRQFQPQKTPSFSHIVRIWQAAAYAEHYPAEISTLLAYYQQLEQTL